MKIIHVGLSYDHRVHSSPDIQGEDIESMFEKNHYGSWATRLVRQIHKRHKNYEMELWRPYDSDFFGNRGVSVLNKWNVTFRTFPTNFFFRHKIGDPKRHYTNTLVSFSASLIQELRRTIGSGEKILVHLGSLEKPMSYLIAKQCKNIPIVAQQRGGNYPPLWKYRSTGKKRHLLVNLLRNSAINNFDYFFCASIGGTFSLMRKSNTCNVMHLKGGGFNFERYVPKSKYEVRKELNLSPDLKYIIWVGRFNEQHAPETLIAVYKELKKIPNVRLICIGGKEDQPQYNEVVNSGIEVMGYIPRDKVIKYMNATDIHLFPTANDWPTFGDFPTAILESLSMNQPVVTPALVNFAGPKSEISKLGFTSNNKDDILRSVKYILDNPEKYKNTRAIVRKYYNWDRIVSENTKVYERLFEKYYD